MKVFINDAGLFYKAEEAQSHSHMQKEVIVQEFIEALPDDGTGMHLVDVEEKVRLALEARKLEQPKSPVASTDVTV